MQVAIVKYNAGNIQSVAYALNRLGIEPVVTNDPEILYKADKISAKEFKTTIGIERNVKNKIMSKL